MENFDRRMALASNYTASNHAKDKQIFGPYKLTWSRVSDLLRAGRTSITVPRQVSAPEFVHDESAQLATRILERAKADKKYAATLRQALKNPINLSELLYKHADSRIHFFELRDSSALNSKGGKVTPTTREVFSDVLGLLRQASNDHEFLNPRQNYTMSAEVVQGAYTEGLQYRGGKASSPKPKSLSKQITSPGPRPLARTPGAVAKKPRSSKATRRQDNELVDIYGPEGDKILGRLKSMNRVEITRYVSSNERDTASILEGFVAAYKRSVTRKGESELDSAEWALLDRVGRQLSTCSHLAASSVQKAVESLTLLISLQPKNQNQEQLEYLSSLKSALKEHHSNLRLKLWDSIDRGEEGRRRRLW